MISESRLIKLKKIFGEIVSGFSVYDFAGINIYIKHLTPLDDLLISYNYENSYNQFKKSGVFTEEEKLKYLIDNQLWDSKNEGKITDSRAVLKDLYDNKRKVFSFKDIEFYNQQIKAEEEFLFKIISEKFELMGETVELLAQKSADLYLVQHHIFKDSELKNFLYPTIEFEDLNVEETEKIFNIYKDFKEDLSNENIKQISINPIFTNIFYLSDSIWDFFGQALATLSHSQIKLVTWGRFFKNIFESAPNIPAEILDNPEKIEDYFSGRANIEKILEKSDNKGGITSLPLSNKELKHYGFDNPVDHAGKLEKALKESKGELSLEQRISAGLI